MISEQSLLFLGEFKRKGDQLAFHICPYCGNSKWNLEVSISLGIWHCWACDEAGRISKLFKLFNLAIPDMPEWKITKKEVPKELLELSKTGPIRFSDYKRFFTAKGIEEEDISKYRFRIGTAGKHLGKLIIPLYEGSNLVYIVGRDLTIKGRYYNIAIEKVAILPYYLGEALCKYTLYLCEGAFDAICLNKLGFSAAALLGTMIFDEQIKKIKRFGFKECVVCLDGDAKSKAIKMYDQLIKSGIKASVAVIDGNEDPNDLYIANRSKLMSILTNPLQITLQDRVMEKLVHAH